LFPFQFHQIYLCLYSCIIGYPETETQRCRIFGGACVFVDWHRDAVKIAREVSGFRQNQYRVTKKNTTTVSFYIGSVSPCIYA